MKFTILGSGSSGNAVLISSENTKVLIDVGLSAREVVRRLAVVGVDPADLDGPLLAGRRPPRIIAATSRFDSQAERTCWRL